MPLSLENFDLDEDKVITRGREYYESGMVSALEETDKGNWVASVLGSQTIYDLEVTLGGKNIKKTFCTCPYFMQHEHCKHVMAVLYAIRERVTTPAKGAGKEKKNKEAKTKTAYQELQVLAEKVNEQDLRTFIKSYAARNTDFTNSFLFYTKQLAVTKEATEEGYSELVKIAVKNSKESGRGYNFINDGVLYKYLKPLTEQIKACLAEQNYLEATYIIKALLGELSVLKETTFSGEKTADVILLCFSFLENIALSDVSFMFKDELYAYSMEKSGQGTYEETIFESNFDKLLLLLANDNAKRAQLLDIINERIRKITPAGGGNIHINLLDKRLDLVNAKIDLLEKMKRSDEAQQFIIDNVPFHEEMRIRAIETAIEAKDYLFAKKLALEKTEERSTTTHFYGLDKSIWNSFLLKIAEAEKDKKEIVRIALNLFQTSLDIKYYQTAKKQVPTKAWAEEIESFLANSRAGHNAFNLYFKVFREENMMDRLFDLLKKNLNIYTLRTLAETLLPKFRKEVLALYKSQLNQLAENAESTSYNLIRDHLKHLIAIGAADKAKEIIDEYRIRYKNRPAMIERLNAVTFK